jgi:hypothetical protein
MRSEPAERRQTHRAAATARAAHLDALMSARTLPAPSCGQPAGLGCGRSSTLLPIHAAACRRMREVRRPDSGLRDPEPMSAASAPLPSGRWASLTVSVDGARHVAIRSTGAGSPCPRDGVTAVTGTVTGSGRADCHALRCERPPRRVIPQRSVPAKRCLHERFHLCPHKPPAVPPFGSVFRQSAGEHESANLVPVDVQEEFDLCFAQPHAAGSTDGIDSSFPRLISTAGPVCPKDRC